MKKQEQQNDARPVYLAEESVGGVTGTPTIKPNRNRSREEPLQEKSRPARPASRKKPATSRKAPARGRYIDEYAQPVI
jgi:hypothetical protein